MAQHGYLHDTYDRDDFGRGDDRDDRERSWRGREDERSWRGRDEERGWRGGDDRQSWSDRDHDRGSMFGWNDRDHQSRHRHEHRSDDDRGFFDRGGDGMKSWFGGDDRGRDNQRNQGSRWQGQHGRSEQGWRGSQGDFGREQRGYGSSSGWQQSGGDRYSAHPDDHYRSWRDKQMQALDRDYQDYCREREQQFHSDFDTWRQNRQNQGQSHGRQSMSQRDQSSAKSGSSGETMELDNPAVQGGDVPGATTSAMGAATLGTNNSENTASAPSATGRGKR